MQKLSEILPRLIGVALLLAALGFAATKAPDRPLESLVGRWALPPSEFLDLNGQLLHIRDVGPREDPAPLLLLHGTSSSLHTWQGWIDGLQKTGEARRIITLDLPGFGLTGPQAEGDYSNAAYLRLIEALLKHLGLQQVVLGGNSLGGELAWEYAAAHPSSVKALILVDAAGYALAPESMPMGFRLARLPVLAHIADYVLPRFLVERSLQSVYGEPSRVSAELVDRYFELTLRSGNRPALRERFAQMQPGAHADKLRQLRLPTLILWGEKDRLIPPSFAQNFARDIVGSRLVMLPGLGHVPQEEDPAASLAPVLDFLHTLKP
ncbi:alpha/beta hydrolase [Paucibacter sp. KBW04]|uniref:alpha/beta fold hydrolase n=1 Tax=Paucibacter sp. KBW04 TaxID=2153361 RepID=UPI000F5870AA|nr:alpha/beta hydrolase [Paucibacter sp. KBW04]RQO63479.1 alpha/beta hydrolase [Paucibacter sp. KBW04]